MCVAIWKDAGVDLLDKETYKHCWTQNDDGGSISVWNEEDEVWNVIKGIMKWETWWETFCNMKTAGTVGKDKKVFIHFRVGTAGKNREQNLTHPFPVTDKVKFLSATTYECHDIIAHNGTIGTGNKDGTLSDTMLGVLDYIEPLWDLTYDDEGEVINEKLEFILKECLDTAVSRWFVANGPHVTLYGPWKHEETLDTWFSNKDHENPWDGYGAFGTFYGHGSGWNGSQMTARYIRTGDIDIYLTDNGEWNWDAWKEMNAFKATSAGTKTTATPPDTVKEEGGLIMAIVDEDGNILWEEDEDADEDLLCCPDCVNEEVFQYDGLNLADYVCHECGALFDSMTGEIFGYDQNVINMVPGVCMYCNDTVLIEPGGNCSSCGAILDLTEAEGGTA